MPFLEGTAPKGGRQYAPLRVEQEINRAVTGTPASAPAPVPAGPGMVPPVKVGPQPSPEMMQRVQAQDQLRGLSPEARARFRGMPPPAGVPLGK